MNLDDDERFADAMKKRREELGISQARLAELYKEWVGDAISQQTIAQMEAKKRRVTIGEALAIAAALQDDIDNMIHGELSATSNATRMRRALKDIQEIVNSEELYDTLENY